MDARIIKTMEKHTILSILIPTKNREKYTLNIIQHILSISNERFQIIIQDNSDTNRLEELLINYKNDKRLCYYYHSEVLSFVDNFSWGISRCTGEYVTIIGDDDGINPLILEITEWAFKNNIEAISPSLPIIYFWPGSGVKFANKGGMLTISGFSCKIKFVKPQKELIKYLKQGCNNYLDYNLAKAYHGIVKRSVLEEIKLKTGRYIGGLSPDIYLSVAISLLVKRVLIMDYPLTVSGICNQSGSSDSSTGKHTGELKNAPHFRGHSNYEWSSKIPPFYSVETIWGDSALAAINDLKQPKYIEYFNDSILSAYCLKSYPEYKSIILDNLKRNHNNFRNILLVKAQLLKCLIIIILKNYRKLILNKFIFRKKYNVFNDIIDMNRVSEISNEFILKESKIIIDKIQKI